MESIVLKALQEFGANPTAKALGVSREACMSFVLGIATNGTRALIAANIGRLESLRVRRAA